MRVPPRSAKSSRAMAARVVNIEKLGRKRLAYEIADLREGNYVAMHFRSTGVASKELERLLKLQRRRPARARITLDKRQLAAHGDSRPASGESATARGSMSRAGGYDRRRRGGYDRGATAEIAAPWE